MQILIFNQTKMKNLKRNFECADNFFKRFLGLMFKRNIKTQLIIKFQNSNRYLSSIHSFFMFQTIDLYFIDKNNTIFEIVQLKPWRIHIPKKEAKYVLEVKKNSIKKEILDENDVLILKII